MLVRKDRAVTWMCAARRARSPRSPPLSPSLLRRCPPPRPPSCLCVQRTPGAIFRLIVVILRVQQRENRCAQLAKSSRSERA